MGIELNDDQLWEFLSQGHEGALTTLRSDGWPVALPVWYVVKDRAVYLRTRPSTKKLVRIRNDPRSSFLVSSGNPKTLIFLSAFMPQFINQHASLALQFGTMFATIAACVICVHFTYAISTRRLKHRFKHHRFANAVRYLGGSVFVLFGLKLLASEKAA